MEINKQLFENVLSGKLKGIFVLRDGRKFNSIHFGRNIKMNNITHPYWINCGDINYTYRTYGSFLADDIEYDCDIVDFISKTNMKENELTIEIPEGKEIDWKESEKQNKIVFKDKQLTYKDVCKKLFKTREIFYTGSSGEIRKTTYSEIKDWFCDKNNATTEHQLECILAKNKLANVAVYLNDGWKPESGEEYYTLVYDRENKKIINSYKALIIGDFIFKSKEFAQQAIEILGEETVKLALEPLGI